MGFEPMCDCSQTDFEGRETAKTPYISAQVRIKYLPQACKNGLFSYLVICVHTVLHRLFSCPGTIWAPRAPIDIKDYLLLLAALTSSLCFERSFEYTE